VVGPFPPLELAKCPVLRPGKSTHTSAPPRFGKCLTHVSKLCTALVRAGRRRPPHFTTLGSSSETRPESYKGPQLDFFLERSLVAGNPGYPVSFDSGVTREQMTKICPIGMSDEVETLPKGWTMLQCAKCHLIFALPPLKGDSTRKLADEQLRKELLRHVQESHQEDFSQAAARIVREATEQK
jgi:hypothetical protein